MHSAGRVHLQDDVYVGEICLCWNQPASDFTYLDTRADANHTFSSGSVDWGFTTFLPLRDLYNAQKGYLVDDTLEVASLPLPAMMSLRLRY